MRIALLTYRGNPFCGGQGVYIRNLSRELIRLGHTVEVFAGQPYPLVDPGVRLTPVASLDLYREPDPFRLPRPREYRDWIDILEVATMLTGGFPEPLTFSLRARRLLKSRRADFDVVHDNQCLGYGILRLPKVGLPLVTTIHHPVQIDRATELASATGWRWWGLRRWYGFTRMQRRVARRLEHVVTVSNTSRIEIVDHLGVRPTSIRVVPIGTDPELFSPAPDVVRVPGRIFTMTSADVPLKGLLPLVEAVAKIRAAREVELVVVGAVRPRGPVASAIERFGLEDGVRFTGRLSDEDLVAELRLAEIAVIPSLFEGFSLPLVEAMACGTPVVTTTGGALPEVAGPDGTAALLVAPGDAGALSVAMERLLDDQALRSRLGHAGRERVLARFAWPATAEATVACYRQAMRAVDRSRRGDAGTC